MSTTDELFLFAHILAVLWYAAGLTAVQLTIIRGWQSRDIAVKADAFDEASHYQGVLLVPGGIAVVATGLFLFEQLDYNLIGPAWLFIVEAIYIVSLLVCLPLVGMGLRRARIAALQAQRAGHSTPLLDQAMEDNVPLFFAGIATLLVPLAAFFEVFRPF
jgi:uncharacterized membrane protein